MDTNIVGHTLRITFDAEGLVDVGGSADAVAGTNKTVWLYADDNATPDAISEAFVTRTTIDGLTKGGWNGGFATVATTNGSAYIGRFYIDIPIYESGWTYGGVLGGGLGIRMFATALAGVDTGGAPDAFTGYARAYDPMFFESITLPDKGNVTPESLGVGLSFDSGMQSPNLVSAVPEPGSFTILAGLFAMSPMFLRRRKSLKLKSIPRT